MSDRLLKESDVLKIAFQLPYVVNSTFFDAVKALPPAGRPQEDYNRGYCDAVQGIADEMVKRGKCIVQDRPQGEWKRRLVDNGFNADWVCSECGYRVKTDFVSFNFCPNCGARMKGVDDEVLRQL